MDFVTHPAYQIDIDTLTLAKVCANQGTLLEINARHGQLIKSFVEIAAKTKVKFILNSDAHSPNEVGEFTAVLKVINDLKIDPKRIVNIRGNV